MTPMTVQALMIVNTADTHTSILSSDTPAISLQTVPVVSGGTIEPAKLTKKDHTATMRAWVQGCQQDNVNDRKALTTALLYLFARQTSYEQSTGATSVNNGMGFTGVDAEFLSSVASRCKKTGREMTTGQFPYVQKKLVKYAGQLMGMLTDKAGV